MSANSRMTQLSRELNKKGWKSKEDASWESDSSDLFSPEIPRSDPTPSQGLQKQNGRVARRLKFGENGESENEAEDQTDSELDEPPRKQPRSKENTQKDPDETDNASTIDQTLALLLQEVKKTNSELTGVSSRLQSVEKRLEVIEEGGVVSSSSADSTKKKRTVPNKVRQEFRDLYKSLLEDEKIEGFDVKQRYLDKHNQATVDHVVKEVKGIDPSAPTFQIREAGKRFFQSKVEEESLKARGKYDEKVVKQRKRNRLTRKRDDRLATLIKTSSVSNENKDKWKEILTIDFMSSEESGVEENSDGSERHVLNVSDLHWRAENVTSFLHRLDDKRAKKKSKKSEMQTRPRVNTGISDRCKPQTFPDNHWAFKK